MFFSSNTVMEFNKEIGILFMLLIRKKVKSLMSVVMSSLLMSSTY